MADAYQAIYDAARSQMRNGDVGGAVENAIRDLGIGHEAHMASYAIQNAAASYEAPSAIYKPTLSIDGNMYCALYGENLHDGCAGFGKTVAEAMSDFDKNWFKQKAPDPKGPGDAINDIRKDLAEIAKAPPQ